MNRKEKFEQWAKEWEGKVPNLAKALRSDSLHQSLNEMDILILGARISERSLIVYTLESALMDEVFPVDYKMALKDEIQNHNIAIQEYKEELKKLTPNE